MKQLVFAMMAVGVASGALATPTTSNGATQQLEAEWHGRSLCVTTKRPACTGMLTELLPKCDAVVATASQNPRALPPPTLASLAEQLGGPVAEVIRDPRAALARARELAGPAGVVVVTGSIYLVADLLRPAGTGRASML